MNTALSGSDDAFSGRGHDDHSLHSCRRLRGVLCVVDRADGQRPEAAGVGCPSWSRVAPFLRNRTSSLVVARVVSIHARHVYGQDGPGIVTV